MNPAPRKLRVLILGGTSEARLLGQMIAVNPRFDALMSLAGRTKTPLDNALPLRIGGFGGVAGLTDFLKEGRFDALVDTTHPFANQMRRHAVESAGAAGVPLLRLSRPAWQSKAGDRWIDCASSAEAADRVGDGPERIFLAMGRLEIEPFLSLLRPALIRTVDPLDRVPQGWIAITETGPFDLAREKALFEKHRIYGVVAKNAGGPASFAKIEAARQLGLPVFMIRRPPDPEGLVTVPDIADVLAWLTHQSRPTDRAV
jgi:precorrin-6A/cobalt-precorrin-6A reductase